MARALLDLHSRAICLAAARWGVQLSCVSEVFDTLLDRLRLTVPTHVLDMKVSRADLAPPNRNMDVRAFLCGYAKYVAHVEHGNAPKNAQVERGMLPTKDPTSWLRHDAPLRSYVDVPLHYIHSCECVCDRTYKKLEDVTCTPCVPDFTSCISISTFNASSLVFSSIGFMKPKTSWLHFQGRMKMEIWE